MKLNHINLPVTDLDGAEKFLTTYFGLRNEWPATGERKMAVLFDDDDLVLTLFKVRQAEYPGIFHIGFIQANEEAVDAVYQRLKAGGFEVKAPERHHAWTFYVQAPGGFMVEVLA